MKEFREERTPQERRSYRRILNSAREIMSRLSVAQDVSVTTYRLTFMYAKLQKNPFGRTI